MNITQRTFTNADQEIVPYDGSPLKWRVSAYSFIVKDHQLLVIQNRLEKLSDIVGGAKIKIGELLHAHTDWFYHRSDGFHQTVQLFYKAELVGELSQPTDPDIEWAKWINFAEVGKKYHLPPVVEEIFAEQIQP